MQYNLYWNVNDPTVMKTLSFQKIASNCSSGQSPKLSAHVRNLRLTPFRSLIDRVCYTLLENPACQMFRWLKGGTTNLLDR